MSFRTKLCSLFATAALTVATHAQDFERTVGVSAGSDLYVSTNSGHIHLYPGSDNSIHIKAHLHARWSLGGSEDRMRRICQNPPIHGSGNTVRVGEASPEDRGLFNNISIDYEISAPRDAALNLHTGSGDLQIDNLGRFLKADTGSGSVRAHGIAGSANLHTGSGDIELQQTVPGEIVASTGSGSIRIDGFSGALTARTGSGDIEVNGHITGASKLQSGSGSLRVHLGHDAHLNIDAYTGSGTIRVTGLATSEHGHLTAPLNGGGPMFEAHTGSGDIEIGQEVSKQTR